MSSCQDIIRLFFKRPIIFSGRVNKNDGFDAPAPLHGVSGWTVYKMQQTEIYKITHNLNIGDAQKHLHVVATPMDYMTIIRVEDVAADTFTISTWHPNGAGKSSDFMFIASYYP